MRRTAQTGLSSATMAGLLAASESTPLDKLQPTKCGGQASRSSILQPTQEIHPVLLQRPGNAADHTVRSNGHEATAALFWATTAPAERLPCLREAGEAGEAAVSPAAISCQVISLVHLGQLRW
jgi:hypothetical protein